MTCLRLDLASDITISSDESQCYEEEAFLNNLPDGDTSRPHYNSRKIISHKIHGLVTIIIISYPTILNSCIASEVM